MSRSKGLAAEAGALEYLKSKQYQILAKNYHCAYGEIDIICLDGEVLVFVEVKMRRNDYYGYPEESVNEAKIKRIRKTALSFLYNQKKPYKELRFDVISILGDLKHGQIRHIENAF